MRFCLDEFKYCEINLPKVIFVKGNLEEDRKVKIEKSSERGCIMLYQERI